MASSALLDIVTAFGARDERIVHVRDIAQRIERDATWPDWIDEELRHACHANGVDALWEHQLEAANTARDGSDVVIATPTASGKSLGFWLPVLESIQATRDQLRTASAIYIAPTKALAADQLAKCAPTSSRVRRSALENTERSAVLRATKSVPSRSPASAGTSSRLASSTSWPWRA